MSLLLLLRTRTGGAITPVVVTGATYPGRVQMHSTRPSNIASTARPSMRATRRPGR